MNRKPVGLSELTRMHSANREPEHQGWDVLEAVADGVVVADRGGVMLFVSERLAALLGYEPAELVGKEIEVLIDGRSRRSHRSSRADFLVNGRVRPMGLGLEIHARCKGGELVPVDVQLHPVGIDGLVLASVRDLRSTQELERRFEEMTTREGDARALLDLVVQRLFGISATIAALSADAAPAAREHLMSSALLVDETVQLIRSVSGEAHSGRQNLAGRQSDLLRTSGPSS